MNLCPRRKQIASGECAKPKPRLVPKAGLIILLVLSGLLSDSTSAFVRYEGEAYGGSRSSALKVGLTMRF